MPTKLEGNLVRSNLNLTFQSIEQSYGNVLYWTALQVEHVVNIMNGVRYRSYRLSWRLAHTNRHDVVSSVETAARNKSFSRAL